MATSILNFDAELDIAMLDNIAQTAYRPGPNVSDLLSVISIVQCVLNARELFGSLKR
jgi:hypothetical protein